MEWASLLAPDGIKGHAGECFRARLVVILVEVFLFEVFSAIVFL